MKRKLLSLFRIPALLAALVLFPGTVSAWQPYDTFYVSHGTGGAGTRVYWMQDVYAVAMTVVGREDRTLKQPADLFVAGNDHLFVADKGNNRIVEFDRNGEWIRQIGDTDGPGALKAPEGVFVGSGGEVYVADTGNQRVAVFGASGQFAKEYKKPAEGLLPASYYFMPTKVVVDARDVMYIVSKGSYQGIVRMDRSGEFTGFFGGNKTAGTWLDSIKRRFFTKEQMAKEELKRPPEINNETIDGDGYIFAMTTGVSNDQIKKLTAGGVNRFKGLHTAKFADSDQIADIATDADDFFYVLDRKESKWDSMISIYSPGGTQLFTFGRTVKEPQQRGVLSYPASLGIDSGHRLWVLDSDQGLLQAYDRTAFGDAVMTAAADYYIGDYEKSEENWNKVLSLNEVIGLTYVGLGEAARKEGRIEDAMAYFRMSYDNVGYSEAFWTYRLGWIQTYFGYAAGIVLLVGIGYRYGRKRLAKTISDRAPDAVKRIGRELKDAWRTMFHPFDGFYRIKGRKLSPFTMLILLGLVALMKWASLYWTGFIFHPYNLDRIKPLQELATFLAPFFAWVVANYLVSTVKDGEGRFRDVAQSSLFALLPYVFLTPFAIVLSRMLVLEEGILVSSLQSVMWLWIGALFVVSSQVIHNFEFIENVKNSAITVLTIGILFLFATVTTGLTYNLSDFIYQVYKEATVFG
ncbi:YIP1 family protein [Cohnella sp. GCM10027633]|uniref:YIP1 family protein n=1 Tax=unclassified Cohnella TaxID=2636738 RepID=UPI0036356015